MSIIYTNINRCELDNDDEEGDGIRQLLTKKRIVYRHYATLFFIFIVDSAESDLAILDLIQVFVEVLDRCFENVCELDLIFNFDKVFYVLNEIICGGVVVESK